MVVEESIGILPCAKFQAEALSSAINFKSGCANDLKGSASYTRQAFKIKSKVKSKKPDKKRNDLAPLKAANEGADGHRGAATYSYIVIILVALCSREPTGPNGHVSIANWLFRVDSYLVCSR